MNEKQITKIEEGCVTERARKATHKRKKHVSLSIPGVDQFVFGCLISAERMAKH